jgi:pSer/pThr/pTyr-binding forkhead associated (FHA) protein
VIRGQLIVMNGPDRGLDYAIPVGRSELGRAPDAAIPLADENVSRQHAVIESTEQRVVLIDLGSVNGTWVNNRRLNGPCPLRDGDIVAVGAVTLQFRSSISTNPARLSADHEPVAFDEVGHDKYLGRGRGRGRGRIRLGRLLDLFGHDR